MRDGIKLQIVSDGTPAGTRVEDIETGDRLRGVQGIAWGLKLDGTAEVVLRLKNVPANLIGELNDVRSTVDPMTGDAGDATLEDSVTIRDDEHDHKAPGIDPRTI